MVVEYVGEVATFAKMRDTDTIPGRFYKKTENRLGFALRYTIAAITRTEAGSRSGSLKFRMFKRIHC